MLCEDCKIVCVGDDATEKVQSGNTTTFIEHPFKSSFMLLKSSAQAGCRCCTFLVYCLESNPKFHNYPLLAVEAAPVILKWWEDCPAEDGGAYLSVRPLSENDGHAENGEAKGVLATKLEIFTIRDVPNPQRKWTMNHEVPADPLSEFSVNMARGWINECILSHAFCNDSTLDDLPSRVVDVDSPGRRKKLRLVDSSTVLDLSGKYATLSHCWGQVDRTTTTTSTLAQMERGITISSLSPTFRDAVQVAQSLGIRYLWIDSLCIIQDSLEDKNRELPKMAEIFANSLLTIAGSSSANSQQSFLKPRSSGLHYVQLGDPAANLYLRKMVRSFAEEIRNSTLSQRAWVFQEAQLCRRILYYGVDKMIWRCREHWAREDSTSGFDMAFTPEVQTLYHGRQRIMGPKRKFEDDGSSLIDRLNWYSLVDQYSRKQLTYPFDKLPAISAIAQEVHRLTGDTYLAGPWKGDLINGLLWQRALGFYSDILYAEVKEFVRLENSETPSWSWAAYDGLVETHKWRHRDNDIEELVTVKDASVDLLSASYPTGPVSGGTLTLSGLCHEIQFDGELPEEGFEIIDDRVRMKNWEIEVTVAEKVKLTITFDVAEERKANGSALCLLMTKHNGGHVNQKWIKRFYQESELYCLILRSSPAGNGQYRRVGVGIIEGDDAVDKSMGWERRTVTVV